MAAKIKPPEQSASVTLQIAAIKYNDRFGFYYGRTTTGEAVSGKDKEAVRRYIQNPDAPEFEAGRAPHTRQNWQALGGNC